MVTGKSMNASNSARIERIFASSDRNEDGCLDKVSWSSVHHRLATSAASTINPSTLFSRSAASNPNHKIQRMTMPHIFFVQSEFAELLRCVNNDVGLDDGQVALILDEVWASFPKHLGPHGLTLDGLKQIYLEGYADVERDYEAFVRARGDDTAAAIQHVSGGRLGMAAGTRQLALADASPAKGDIFSAVKPPAGAADSDDDASTSLTFALLVPGTATEEEFAASGQRQQLLSALRDSLPDGSSARVASMIPTAGGLAVGVLCALPSGAQEGDEVQYFNTVMAAEPEQIFPASTFGQVKVVSASPEAAASASAASAASAEAAAAAALAGAPGKVAMAFTVRLPKVDAASFARVKGARFMAQMQAAMPPGASAKVAHVATSPGGGLLVTVGAAVPVAQGTQAAQFLRKLRGDPGSVLSAKDFGPPWLVAASKATAQAPALAVQVRVPAGAPEGEQQQRAQALAGALITALPEGSTTAVRSVESDTQGRKDGALVTLIAALPASTSTAEYRRIAAELQASGWIPGSPTAPKAHCIAAGGALELAFGPESEDDGLHFGLGTSGNGRSRSPSPTRALFGRLFGRTAQDRGQVTAQVDAAGASPPSPTSPPADAIIAGYQRRSPSSAGSAGLADAVGELHLAEATTPASVSPAVAAALAAAAEVSPLKRGDDKAAAPVISVVAYAGKQEEKPAVADVVPADEETDGAAVDAAGARAGVEQQPGQEVQAEQQGESLGQHEMSSPSKSGKKGMWRSLLGALSPSKQRPVGVAPSEATAPPENGGAGPSGAATAAQGGELEAGPQALTPYEVQQRLNAKEWAVMDAHVGQIMAQLQYTLDAAAAAGVVADVSSVQDAASMLPAWARHAAHMDIGDKLGQYGM